MKREEKLETIETKFLTISQLAAKILQDSDHPLSVNEITKKILERKVISSNTPNSSVSAALQKSNKFKRVRPGFYELR